MEKLVCFWERQTKRKVFLIFYILGIWVLPIILFGYICPIIPNRMQGIAWIIFMFYIATIKIGTQFLEILVEEKSKKEF